MTELTLSQDHQLLLRAQAHRLDPVVLLGAGGLSDAALREIDRALNAHGLVKIRGGKAERDEREALFATMAQRLRAARIQLIGNTFVLFRPQPLAPAKSARTAGTGRGPGTAKGFKGTRKTTGTKGIKADKAVRAPGAKVALQRNSERSARSGRPAAAPPGAAGKSRPAAGRARAATRQR
jgi:putative YhbY family RNA-binding protein